MKQLSSAVLLAVSLMVGCSWGGEDEDSNFNPPIPDASVSAAVCGDAVCAASEVGTCTQDCGSGGGSGSGSGTGTVVCGNNVCDTGETNSSCPNDCTGGGSGSGACPADPLTDCLFCSLTGQMCPTGLDMDSCLACLAAGGGGGGGGGGACNFNMVCDIGEDATTCPTDCP